MVEKYSVSLKKVLQQGISELEFYGDLVYRFRKIVGKSNFTEQFRKLINRYKRIQAPTHWLKFYEEAVIESEARTAVVQLNSEA